MTKRTTSLWLLIPLIGFPQIGETIFTPSLPNMARVFATSASSVNMSLSVYLLGLAIGVLFFGMACDRWGRRPAMLLGLFTYMLASALCIFSPAIEFLLVSRLLQGFGASVGSVVTQTIMRDLFVGANRGRVFSIVTAALALSPAVGPLAGGILDEAFGFRGNLTLLFIIGLVLLVVSIFWLKESRDEGGKSKAPVRLWPVFRSMIGDSFIWRSVFLIAGCNGILFSFYGEAPYIFQEVLGFSPSEYGRLGFAAALSSMLGAFLSHRLAGKLSAERIVQLGVGLTLLGALGFWAMSSQQLIHAAAPLTSAGCILGSMFFILVGFALIIPNTLAVALKSYQNKLGAAGACFGLMYYILISAFTEGMGLVHDGSVIAMPRYFVGIAVFMLLVCFVPVLLRGRRESTMSVSM